MSIDILGMLIVHWQSNTHVALSKLMVRNTYQNLDCSINNSISIGFCTTFNHAY